jgi:hypothetical protein
MLTLAPSAFARSNGLATSDCSGCHSGSAAPVLSLSFDPEQPAPGDAVNLTLEIKSPAMSSAGFYLWSDDYPDFSLPADQPLRSNGDGVTHSAPIAASDGVVRVQIAWQTPSEPGGTLFEVAAVAANGDRENRGDAAAKAQFALVWGCAGVTLYHDFDADGFGSEAYGTKPGCAPHDVWVAQSGDCDEDDSTIHPGGSELCNGKDDDCNGETDEGTTPHPVYEDADGDGFGVWPKVRDTCEVVAGYADNADDCSDDDPELNPAAAEVCNSKDDNCDGRTDEGVRERCGVGWCERLSGSCEPGTCIPGEPSAETCNGLDDDCDGETDEMPCSEPSAETSTVDARDAGGVQIDPPTQPNSNPGVSSGPVPPVSASELDAATGVGPEFTDGKTKPRAPMEMSSTTRGACGMTPSARNATSSWLWVSALALWSRRRRALGW